MNENMIWLVPDLCGTIVNIKNILFVQADYQTSVARINAVLYFILLMIKSTMFYQILDLTSI